MHQTGFSSAAVVPLDCEQSYCTRNPSTRAAKPRAARNEGVSLRRKSLIPFSNKGGGGEGDRVVTTSRFPYPVFPPPVPFCPFRSRPPPFSETDETLTRLTPSTHVYMCHSISFMTYDLERFPISLEVNRVRILFFDFFSIQNFALSHRER